ncbi:nucleotide disphospho-sugar-binding domain-containing protein [Streptomyces viridochromogenes]|uniref:nucleotide disphospho-sugar-binding domain-containing protein n=1 Tax=Streptomyces viridochromogenes TaxID=1938 RepID=UPI00065C9B87|nr:nucleotide disphospho-sugar-binding domain-containing protein [Streptomyces viridochromogenes]
MTPPRVLFTTWAAPGHLYPMVPLAWAFRAAGADVLVAVPPACEAVTGATGLPVAVVGEDAAAPPKASAEQIRSWGSPRPWPAGWTVRPELLDAEQTAALSFAAAKQVRIGQAMADDLVRLAGRFRPDLVVCDTLCFAGPVAAAAVGVPHLAQGWELATLLRAERLDRGEEWLPGYAELFERYGLEPRALCEDLVDVSPPSTRVAESTPVRRIPMRFVPYNGAGRRPAWLAERPRRPRVVVTSGIALGRYDAATAVEVTRSFVRSVALPGVDLVVAAGPDLAARLDGLPTGTRVATGVPFHVLLPACDAVVHHGGAGTALTAVVSGVPQVVVPQAPPYAEIADRIRRSGAGVTVDPGDGAAAVRDALERMLGDGDHRAALAAVRAEIRRQPSPADVAAGLRRALSRPGALITGELPCPSS